MVDTTLRTLTPGTAVSDGDLFISRQGADTEDKSVTGTQLKTYAQGTLQTQINTKPALGVVLAIQGGFT